MTKSNRLIVDDEDDVAPPQRQTQQPAAQEPLRETARPAAPVKRRRSKEGGKGAYPGLRQINAYIPDALFRWFKVMHIETGKPMVQLMEEALSEYRDRYSAQRKFGGL